MCIKFYSSWKYIEKAQLVFFFFGIWCCSTNFSLKFVIILELIESSRIITSNKILKLEITLIRLKVVFILGELELLKLYRYLV